MKKLIALSLATLLCAITGYSQVKNNEAQIAGAEAKAHLWQEIRDAKRAAAAGPELNVANPAGLNDVDSFGKEVKFLGSMYAGSVFIAASCSAPDVPPNLAPDDKCLPKPQNQSIVNASFSDPAWQITIPGNKIKNVIYLLYNNSVVYDNSFQNLLLSGQGFMSYNLTITIENEALNSPQAINPANGSPMNGVFTSGAPGSKFRVRTFTAGQFEQEVDSYASVMGRGISRAFWRDVGLPESVIDNFYKKDTTLKFGIRVTQTGAIAYGQFFYTVRALGQ